ncbi:hypothetical protein TNCT_459241 [Trichonephila clavata]|uniref:Uncharacterized protein n=1 Tax=Trichonephila clavata TaxID=2740835 RepID=A0A8X6HX97_TRICU|nr:hypothetical protein TNCT_459241 [Trichonephila clavata]
MPYHEKRYREMITPFILHEIRKILLWKKRARSVFEKKFACLKASKKMPRKLYLTEAKADGWTFRNRAFGTSVKKRLYDVCL